MASSIKLRSYFLKKNFAANKLGLKHINPVNINSEKSLIENKQTREMKANNNYNQTDNLHLEGIRVLKNSNSTISFSKESKNSQIESAYSSVPSLIYNRSKN